MLGGKKDVPLKQATEKRTERKPLAIHMGHRLREGIFLLSIAIALFLIISFISYHATDPGWSSTGWEMGVANWGGRAGAFAADVFLSIFGFMTYLLPPLIVFAAWLGVREEEEPFRWRDFIFKSLGFILVVLSVCALSAIYLTQPTSYLPANSGGIVGDIFGKGLVHLFNKTGATLVLVTAFTCGLTLFSGFSWVGLVDAIGWYTTEWWMSFKLKRSEGKEFQQIEPKIKESKSEVKEQVAINSVMPDVSREANNLTSSVFSEERHWMPDSSLALTSGMTTKKQEPYIEVDDLEEEIIEPKLEVKKSSMMAPPVIVATTAPKPKPPVVKKLESVVTIEPGTVPPFNLLNPPAPSQGKAFSNTTFEELSQLVEQRLLDFGVQVKVVAVHPGPVITLFELELAPGIKVSKISGLAKDIARSLSATSVRVVEVIPGKSVIGLELPNEFREVVCLREILESQRYAQAKSPVSLALGKDIAGFPVVVDLAKMPHLLVAGTTGSGKSVSINSMILSLLFKATPDQLRLILIDPKMLELSVYEGIPHLLTPVITDMKDAANALRWCVGEMDRRYKLMASLGVRNLAGYNTKINEAKQQGNPIPSPAWLTPDGCAPLPLEPLPMIVVVADELADMMMVVGKKIEDLITRIAQKARAAGIHLILATQRPSVDVITGLIKANVPTRIAFQVSSRIDSRTILDQQGAEQLLGNGDMLYLPPGTGVPVRVHGAFVADEEVHRVVAAWQTYGKPTYLEEITEGGADSNSGADAPSGEMDPLYDEALKVVTESRRASISLVQRRLKIGYNRAARIMEDMEAAGVVSTMDGNGSREVLAPPPVEV